MGTRTIKHHATAWVTKYSIRDYGAALQSGDDARMAEAINFSNNERMGVGKDAWTRVGSAVLTIEIEDQKKVVKNAVKALRSQQSAIRAEAEKDAIAIERQIQSLLAITNEVRA